eukprot:scaffold7926_cov31-Tisochrysis_lutea.AAC.3
MNEGAILAHFGGRLAHLKCLLQPIAIVTCTLVAGSENKAKLRTLKDRREHELIAIIALTQLSLAEDIPSLDTSKRAAIKASVARDEEGRLRSRLLRGAGSGGGVGQCGGIFSAHERGHHTVYFPQVGDRLA